MGSTFNPQILVDKLTKLNNSQQSIETLSHWCIFHMNKAKQVVETWERQFHSSPREQRLAFLYLANDILQNSRRKGVEFVTEFWRVLPEALRDVIQNGDSFGRNAALRLISIWEERKVFGSRGHILKEEFVGRPPESNSRNARQVSTKLRHSLGDTLDKIVSGYEEVYGSQVDEDAVLSRCGNTVSSLEKVEKDIGGNIGSGGFNGFGVVEELQGQHGVLRDFIDQLTVIEASRASLVSLLREALQEQEFKLEQVHSQLQAAQLRSEQAANLCQQLLKSDDLQLLDDQKDAQTSAMPPGFVPTETHAQAAPVVYTRQVPVDDDDRKSAAAAVAAKLTASTASAEMLSHVLTSLVSGGVIGNAIKESPTDHPDKKPKLDNDQQQQPPPPLSSPPPPPPLPPMPPFPMPQFLQSAGSMSNVAYTYGVSQPALPPPLPGYPPMGPPVMGMSPFGPPPENPYRNFRGSDGGFYSQPSSVPMAPVSRQQS